MLTKEQKDNIGKNINSIIFMSGDIVREQGKALQTQGRGRTHENHMITNILLGNLAIAVATLAMFFLEDADESRIHLQ